MPIYNRLLKEGKIDPKSVRMLAELPAIPEYMWTFRDGLDPAFKEEIRKAFTNVTDPEALKVFRAEAFIPCVDLPCGPCAHLDRRDPCSQSRCSCGSAMISEQLHPEIAAVLADGRRRLLNTLGAAIAAMSIVACAFVYAGALICTAMPMLSQRSCNLPPMRSRRTSAAGRTGASRFWKRFR